MSRYDRILNGAALWGAYYRNNPDKFAEDYLHLRLKIFQRILLTMMFWSTTFVLIACRGLGKTFISAVYCVIRCILFPGTKVCIASGTRGQATNVLEKIILELKPLSPELRAEINEKESKLNGTDAKIVFHNTSVIKVVTAKDSSRGNRCNVLLLDEYRLISKDTIDVVLKKFLTLRRMPRYEELSDEERKIEYAKEKNLTMYLSSAYFKDHWSYTKCVDTFKAMLNDTRRQFVCGFPYQLSIEEGLLDPEAVVDEMLESDFSEIKWSMEMCAEWFGSSDGAFFDSSNITKNRRIKYPMLPSSATSGILSSTVSIPHKQPHEIRILSADIGLMSSKKHNNDASSIFINQLLLTKADRYISNIVYTENNEGCRTDEQALVIRKLYDEFMCDYIVLDTNGIGLGVYDALAKEIVDPDTGEIYPALSCINDKTMAERCTVIGAPKVIWSVKASAQFNSDCAVLLREAFRSGRIRLLVSEYEADELLKAIKGYKSLSPGDQVKFKLPYINTTLLIDELTKLRHEESAGKIRIFERSGMRKDRYSSLSYNYYVAVQLENKLIKFRANQIQTQESFIIKAPKYHSRKAVNKTFGYCRQKQWSGN
nr:MAG TPA: large terminase [Caudoviricetes sp.]